MTLFIHHLASRFLKQALHKIRSLCVLSLTLLTFLQVSGAAHGAGGFTNNVSVTSGSLGAVAIKRDSAGNPMLAEFDSDGFRIGELPAGFNAEGIHILSAQSYNALVVLADQLKQANPGSRLMSRGQYEEQSLKTPGNVPVVLPSIFAQSTRSVLMVDERQLLLATPLYASVILKEFPVDLSQGGSTLPSDIITVLINDEGRIVYRSRYDISFDIGLFEDNQNPSTPPLSPVANAFIYSGVLVGTSGFGVGVDVTDEAGKYAVTVWIPPCPGFSYMTRMPITAEVTIANFNPKAEGQSGHITVQRNDTKFCAGFSAFPPVSRPPVRNTLPVLKNPFF